MVNEGNGIHNLKSSSGSGTVINYGSDFLTSYGSGSTTLDKSRIRPLGGINRIEGKTSLSKLLPGYVCSSGSVIAIRI